MRQMSIFQEKKEKYKYFKRRKFRELIKIEFKNPVSIFSYSNVHLIVARLI